VYCVGQVVNSPTIILNNPVFVVPYAYLFYYFCIAVLTSDAGMLARSQYPEGPETYHIDTGFPCVYKRMLR